MIGSARSEGDNPMTDDQAGLRGSRLFTLRIWTETVGQGTEHRGSVRDVATGAHRSFRQWSDLTSFLVEQVQEGRSVTEDV
jgi:hypothetical protein